MQLLRGSVVITALLLLASSTSAAPLDTAKIEQLTGAKGKMDEKEGAFKVSLPRTDINVTAGGVKMTPAMGLTCWASFMKIGDHAMVMGDQVLLEDQVNPVMSVALDNGLEVTALHNHFFWDSPKVMFMHIGGSGDEARLAEAVGKVFAKIKQTSAGKGETITADIDTSNSSIDPKKIDAIVEHPGELSKGIYKITIGRSATMMDQTIGNTMGVNTWAAFAGTDDRAVVDGDFAMPEQELQGVLKALRSNHINIVAIHNHMTGESPRIIFLHFWGIGSTTDLAKGIKSALDTQK